MNPTLYDHFDQATVLGVINQIPRWITWVSLDHNFFVTNHSCLEVLGFTNQNHSEGKSYIHVPSKVSESYQFFAGEDEKVKESKSPVESIGLYCYSNDEWKVIRSTKSLIKSPDGSPIGICTDFFEIKNTFITQSLAKLAQLEQHLKPNKSKGQVSYELSNKISSPEFSLTERQTECLFYLLRGFTVPMIAEKMFVSTRTIESHIENIKLAVGCYTKADLLEKALL
jgi:DNA-binding CsgD family transcriptional regulator